MIAEKKIFIQYQNFPIRFRLIHFVVQNDKKNYFFKKILKNVYLKIGKLKYLFKIVNFDSSVEQKSPSNIKAFGIIIDEIVNIFFNKRCKVYKNLLYLLNTLKTMWGVVACPVGTMSLCFSTFCISFFCALIILRWHCSFFQFFLHDVVWLFMH